MSDSQSKVIELLERPDPSGMRYLEQDLIRNALSIWYLTKSDPRFKLYVSRVDDVIRGHLAMYDTPEGIYTDLGGEEDAADGLLPIIPKKGVVTTTSSLAEFVQRRIKFDSVYPNDFMLVSRGEEKLRNPERATRLSSEEHSIEYASFGSSFNMPSVPMDWIRESLERDYVCGMFENDKLVSVASLVSWLPKVAVIMGVETKDEFRRRGFASIVVSAVVKEGLARSESCCLFVRSGNESAIALYKSLGFRKFGVEYWMDLGTGMIP